MPALTKSFFWLGGGAVPAVVEEGQGFASPDPSPFSGWAEAMFLRWRDKGKASPVLTQVHFLVGRRRCPCGSGARARLRQS
ncbi:MAG: hypothetical protein DCC56_05790 [Anaerolineae bacterium]|nr:MAG: hypothetical protein DCC56_05790 [Anaerolineae bacterium]WKZ43634.1 MAG: hypothetical protein QY302_16190 [Anaerolineales bacterium]